VYLPLKFLSAVAPQNSPKSLHPAAPTPFNHLDPAAKDPFLSSIDLCTLQSLRVQMLSCMLNKLTFPPTRIQRPEKQASFPFPPSPLIAIGQ
jgi:hypothetical protein